MTGLNHSFALLLAACLIGTTGCASGDTAAIGPNDRQTRIVMNVLSIFYGEYLDSHAGRPPQDSAAFREYIESRPDELQRYNVQNLDELLNSPRDGQPFVIVCGKRVAPKDSPATPWAAYEQSGLDGIIMAVQVRGGVHDLSASEISQIAGQK